MVHFGPVGVSSISMPAALIWSRIASAAAKSLAARASARCSSRPATRASTALRELLVVAAAGRPGRVGRVEAEDVEHRAHLDAALRGRVGVAGGEQPVALAHGVVDHGDRGRRAEVVVHRGDERVRQRRRPAADARSPARSRKASIRRNPAAASSSASKVNSTCER